MTRCEDSNRESSAHVQACMVASFKTVPTLALLLLAACGDGPSLGSAEAAGPAQLNARLLPLMDSAGVPGLAMAVVRSAGVTWSGGFGVHGVDDPRAVTDSTVFEAASLSKPVFAYIVLKLADKGLLELDEPLAAYAPLAGLWDPRGERITARMVLSHTSGLPNELHLGETLELAFDPGSGFRYSGEGYAYLQRVVEHRTGRPLDDLAGELVFRPLGMTRSSFVWNERFGSDAALGHGAGWLPRRPGHPREARAPSSLHTTVADYGRFVAAILEGRGLSVASASEMVSSQAAASSGVVWGLGWALEESESPSALWHWGDNSNTGFTAFVMISRARREGIVWLANSASGLSLAAPLLEITHLGLPVRLDSLGYERYNDPRRLVREDLDRIAADRGAPAALAVHARLRSQLPRDRFDERLLNVLGYRMLERGRLDEAVQLFQANVELYPASGNVYDSLGEALMAAGDEEAAIANYRRSLRLDPANRNAVEQLRRLGAVP